MYACSTMYGNVIGPYAPGNSIYNRFSENKQTISPRSGTKRVSYDKIKPYRPVVEWRAMPKQEYKPAPERPLGYNLFGQPEKKPDPTEGQQFKPVPETREGVLPATTPVDSAPIKTEYTQQATQTDTLENLFRKTKDLGFSGLDNIDMPGKSKKTRTTGTNPVVSYGVETKEQATSPLNVPLNTRDGIIGDRPTFASTGTNTELLGPTLMDFGTNTEYATKLDQIVQTVKFKGKNQKIQTDYLGFDRGTQTSPIVNTIVRTPIEDTGIMIIDEQEFDSTRPIMDVIMDDQSRRPIMDVIMDEQSRRPLRDVVMDEQSRQPLRDVIMDEQSRQPLRDVIMDEQSRRPLRDVVMDEQSRRPIIDTVRDPFVDSSGNFQNPQFDIDVVRVVRSNGKSQRMSPNFKQVSPTESSDSSKSRSRKKPAPITTNLSPSSGSGSSGIPLIQTLGPRSASSSGSSGKPLMQTVGPRSASSSGSSGKPLMQTVKTPQKKRGRPKKKK